MDDNYEIEYLPIAEEDLEEIIEYISSDNPNIAIKILNEFEQKIGKLSNFPKIGVKPKDERLQRLGYRVLIIKKYLVFYVIFENIKIVEIRRILHGNRRYSFLI